MTRKWVPIEKNWGDYANQEVMTTFEGQLKNRAVAMAVWFLAVEPGVTQKQIEQLAQRDPAIETKANGTKINDYSFRQAKKILNGEAGKKKSKKKRRSSKKSSGTKVSKSLSKLEEALVAKFQNSAILVDDYARLSVELEQVQEAYTKARAALLEIPREHAITLADVDPKAAEILAREGLLTDEPADAPSEPSMV